jgi:hypothetical protein
MKARNKQRWTREDRAELRMHLQRLSNISPYLIVLALPGSFLLLPLLAWWLDRRRNLQRPVVLVVPVTRVDCGQDGKGT